MLTLNIDPKAKKLDFSILLNGETMPLQVTVNRYELDSFGKEAPFRSGLTTFKITECSTNRPWLNAVIKNFLIGKSFDVSDKVADLLKNFLG